MVRSSAMAKKRSTKRQRDADLLARPARRARATQLAPPPESGELSPRAAKRELRAVLQASAESLALEVEQWVRQGATDNPLGAVSAFNALAEYCLPRLARVEQTVKPAVLSKAEVEQMMRELGLDPSQMWDKLK